MLSLGAMGQKLVQLPPLSQLSEAAARDNNNLKWGQPGNTIFGEMF